MNAAEQVLVIMLSSMLAILLLLSIIIAIKSIQILNHLKSLTEKAEQLADKAEAVGEFFQASAGPAALAKLVSNIVSSFSKKHKS